MTGRIHIISVPNAIFNDIKNGQKLYECRTEIFCKRRGITAGDVLYITDNSAMPAHVRCLVTELLPFNNFMSAYNVLGNLLVPDESRAELITEYGEFYSMHGDIFAIGLKLLDC